MAVRQPIVGEAARLLYRWLESRYAARQSFDSYIGRSDDRALAAPSGAI